MRLGWGRGRRPSRQACRAHIDQEALPPVTSSTLPAPSTLPQPPYCEHSSGPRASAKLLDSAPSCFYVPLPTPAPSASVLGPRGLSALELAHLVPLWLASSSLLPLLGVFFLPLSSFRPPFQKHFLKDASADPSSVRPLVSHGPCQGVWSHGSFCVYSVLASPPQTGSFLRADSWSVLFAAVFLVAKQCPARAPRADTGRMSGQLGTLNKDPHTHSPPCRSGS